MKTKFISLYLILMMLISLVPSTSKAAQPIKIIIDGKKEISSDVETYIENGTTMVPIRAIGETLGATVSFKREAGVHSDEEDHITLEFPDGRLINISAFGIFSDGINFSRDFDYNYNIKNNRTFVPLRAIGYALHMDVNWDSANNTVKLSTKGNPTTLPIYFTTNKHDMLPHRMPDGSQYLEEYFIKAKDLVLVYSDNHYILKDKDMTLGEYFKYTHSNSNSYNKEESEFNLYHNNIFYIDREGTKIIGYTGG